MKNIVAYTPAKYRNSSLYTPVDEGVFEYDNPPDAVTEGSEGTKYQYGPMTTSRPERKYFVTSLSFEQEPDRGEGDTPSAISQYPLELLLDELNIWVSDFYTTENEQSESICSLEFGASKPERLQEVRALIGKHVYAHSSNEGSGPVHLVIE